MNRQVEGSCSTKKEETLGPNVGLGFRVYGAYGFGFLKPKYFVLGPSGKLKRFGADTPDQKV